MDEAAHTATHLIEAIAAARSKVEETANIVARAADEADRSLAVGETLCGHAGAIQNVTQQSVVANQAIDAVVEDVEQSSLEIRDAMRRQAETVTAITAAIEETALAAVSSANAIVSVRAGAEAVAEDLTALDDGFMALDEQLKLIDRTTIAFLARVGAWAR